MVRKMSEDSKVRLTGVAYKLSGPAKDPLARMGLEFDVEGAFPDVLRFTHALETSEDFLTVQAFSFSPGESRTIAMHVGAELYLKP
jgi:predicted amidohydrolase